MRTARPCGCEGSPDPMLVTYVKSTIISQAGSFASMTSPFVILGMSGFINLILVCFLTEITIFNIMETNAISAASDVVLHCLPRSLGHQALPCKGLNM